MAFPPRVCPQHPEVCHHLLKMFKGTRHVWLSRIAGKIEIEQVLERGARVRPRLDFQKIDVTEGKHAKDPEENPHPVL